MTTLSTSFYLVLSGEKRAYSVYRKLKAKRIVQTTSSLPKLNKDEVAVRVNVDVPTALFERPELTVNIAVDGGSPRVNIDAETLKDMADRMQEIIGTPVHITCDLPETEKRDE